MAKRSTENKVTWDELSDYHEQVICRVDEKNETLEEAIEAVIGNGKGELFEAIRRFALGDR